MLLAEFYEARNVRLQILRDRIVEFADHVDHILSLRFALGLKLKIEAIGAQTLLSVLDVIRFEVEKPVSLSLLNASIYVF